MNYTKFAKEIRGFDELEMGYFKEVLERGNLSIFFSRILPVIRTFISFPAGIAKMSFRKFCFYTFIGSLIWSTILSYVGVFLGENWESVGGYFRRFDWLIIILLIVFIVWFLYKKIKKK